MPTNPNNWSSLDSEPKTRAPEMIERNPGNISTPALENNEVRIPGWTWKTILVADKSGREVEDLLGIYTYMTRNIPEPYLNWDGQQIEHPLNDLLGSNRAPITNARQWRSPRTWRLSISQLENLLNGQEINLNFDFLSNITNEETRNYFKDEDDFPFPLREF